MREWKEGRERDQIWKRTELARIYAILPEVIKKKFQNLETTSIRM